MRVQKVHPKFNNETKIEEPGIRNRPDSNTVPRLFPWQHLPIFKSLTESQGKGTIFPAGFREDDSEQQGNQTCLPFDGPI